MSVKEILFSDEHYFPVRVIKATKKIKGNNNTNRAFLFQYDGKRMITATGISDAELWGSQTPSLTIGKQINVGGTLYDQIVACDSRPEAMYTTATQFRTTGGDNSPLQALFKASLPFQKRGDLMMQKEIIFVGQKFYPLTDNDLNKLANYDNVANFTSNNWWVRSSNNQRYGPFQVRVSNGEITFDSDRIRQSEKHPH